MPNLKSIVYIPVVDFGEVVLLLLVVVTGGKQSQLLVRLTWTGMDLDWSLTTISYIWVNQIDPKDKLQTSLDIDTFYCE